MMSSILYNPSRKGYLRPSKTLQDLKEKLGNVCIDAKLIECPQNAFELSRLQKRIEELEKQKYRRLADSNREQRVLYNSLSSRHVNDASMSTLSDPIVLEIVDNKLPPPGFRFHSNGNPKLEFISKPETSSSLDRRLGESDLNLDSASGLILPLGSGVKSIYNPIDSPSLKYAEDISSVSRNSPRPVTPRELVTKESTSKTSYNAVDYETEIESLKTIIEQLQKDIATKKCLNLKSSESGCMKHNYLRAHSRTDEPDKSKMKYTLDATFSKPNIGPVKLTSPYFKSNHKCIACEMKLKHVYNETTLKHRKGPQDSKARWKMPPRGTYVQSPSSITTLGRVKSAPVTDINLTKFAGNVKSEEILNSYMITHAAAISQPNMRAISAQLQRSPTTLSSFPHGVHSRHGSSLRRFSSPSERESKIQAFKSRAEIESKDISLKVGDFLKKLKDDSYHKKQKENQKSYYFLNDLPKNENQDI